ncbi:MAG: class I SAM-dependent rRNA methyltransferase [Gemmatimonadales bacterium]|nr:MAG: class I SAM-dependent rRNA methyltransferase [Gemmatimonadales bacterium]
MALRVTPAAERAIRDGHPWVFEGSIREQSRPGTPGDIAVVFDRKNRFLAAGLLDPDRAIRARMLVIGAPRTIDEAFLRARVSEALHRRQRLVSDPHTTGLRIVAGEGDGLSGIIVDRYDDTLVAKVYTRAWIPHLQGLLAALDGELAPRRVVLRSSRNVAADPNTPAELRDPTVRGDPLEPGEGIPFLEHGLHFEAHPVEGHKTGFYLDQRDNRHRVRDLARGLDVLNVFSYSGGFSVAAAAGGARRATSVDMAGPALAQARRHFQMNEAHPQVRGCAHDVVEGDAFQVLDAMGTAGETRDVVVIDPPSFAKEAKQAAGALKAYERLTELAMGVLVRGGLLVQASCSSRVETDDFVAAVHRAAARSGRRLAEVEVTGHAQDHPVGIPENQYLKAVFARAF